MVITQLMQLWEQAFFLLYVFQGGVYRAIKSKLNEAGMFQNMKLLSGSNPVTCRDTREAGGLSPNVSDMQLRNSTRRKTKSG